VNIKRIPLDVRTAIIVFLSVLAIVVASTKIASAVNEDFKTFFAALTAASTPLGSGDKLIVLQGGTDKYVVGNLVVLANGPFTLSNMTINGASNNLTVLAGTQISGLVPVANGGVPVTPVSGGIPCGTSTTTYAFSALLTANLPVIGGGAGACPGLGSVTGSTSKFVTNTGSNTTGQGGSWDASGNWVNNANAVYANVAASFTAQMTFASTLGTQNNQSGTSYTLASTDCGKTVYFTSSSAITVTLPNSLSVPCTIQLEQGGTGQITTVAASGATGPSNPRNFTKTFAQYSVITVFVDTNSGVNGHWILTGDGA
jgi:hypothetical protein